MGERCRMLGRGLEYFIILAVLLLTWQLAGALGYASPVILPSPLAIAERFASLVHSGVLIDNIIISVARVLQGYFLAAFLALTLGVFIGLSARFRRLTSLLIQILKPIPPIAWIPLVILWFGIGETSKVSLIFLGGFFTILTNVVDGIRRTDKRLVEVALTLEISGPKYLFCVVLPGALPNIFTGLRVGLGQCWMCVVAAELVASATGLGYMIMNARQFGQTDVVIIGMLSIGILGKLMNGLLLAIEERVVKWA